MKTGNLAACGVGLVLTLSAQAPPTQLPVEQIRAGQVNGVLVNIQGQGWQLAALDKSLTLSAVKGNIPILMVSAPAPLYNERSVLLAIAPNQVDFTVPDAGLIPGSLLVFLDGIALAEGPDYTLTNPGGTQFTISMTRAIANPQPSDRLMLHYRY